MQLDVHEEAHGGQSLAENSRHPRKNGWDVAYNDLWSGELHICCAAPPRDRLNPAVTLIQLARNIHETFHFTRTREWDRPIVQSDYNNLFLTFQSGICSSTTVHQTHATSPRVPSITD